MTDHASCRRGREPAIHLAPTKREQAEELRLATKRNEVLIRMVLARELRKAGPSMVPRKTVQAEREGEEIERSRRMALLEAVT